MLIRPTVPRGKQERCLRERVAVRRVRQEREGAAIFVCPHLLEHETFTYRVHTPAERQQCAPSRLRARKRSRAHCMRRPCSRFQRYKGRWVHRQPRAATEERKDYETTLDEGWVTAESTCVLPTSPVMSTTSPRVRTARTAKAMAHRAISDRDFMVARTQPALGVGLGLAPRCCCSPIFREIRRLRFQKDRGVLCAGVR